MASAIILSFSELSPNSKSRQAGLGHTGRGRWVFRPKTEVVIEEAEEGGGRGGGGASLGGAAPARPGDAFSPGRNTAGLRMQGKPSTARAGARGLLQGGDEPGTYIPMQGGLLWRQNKETR
ncbi:hypothetical protein NL676_008779 [Syzygium grande]|nr:hypothetical protein NL676_008779 [Syzygium grande]